jgi:hypothetical protein
VSDATAGADVPLESISSTRITLASNPLTIGADAKAFVDQLNKVNAQLASTSSDDPATRGVLNQVVRQLGQVVRGFDRQALAAIGITKADRALRIDQK